MRRLHVRIPAMVNAELRRLTATPMAVVALIALLAVPLLYGGLYLWANKDPYAKLDSIPAAIVVADRGATVDGATVSYGDDVAERLVDDGRFDWHVVTGADAVTGVEDAEYDFAITFPGDFSEALASASTEDPRQATVVLTTNDVNSYLASTIGRQAAEAIRVSIVETVNEQAARSFLLGLSDIRTELVDAAEGATRLADGAGDARDGAWTLADGTARIADGAAALADGTRQVADGAGELASGVDDLASGAARVADGARQVADGNDQLAARADAVGDAAQQAADALPDARARIAADLAALGLDQAQVDTALARLDPVGDTLLDANDTLQATVDRVDALATGADQVADGASSLATGASTAADGASSLAAGATAAADGASSLADGTGTAAAGASSLADGLDTLADGTAQLRDGLASGVAQIPDASEELQDRQAQTIADPVALDTTALNDAGGYGAGLAPFFISLAAWIGIYALFLIVKPFSRRAITALHSPVRITVAGWLTPGSLGAVQMVALFAIVSLGLGFDFAHPWGAFGLMALASFTFAAIILALNVWLGSVGQFLGLVLMVLQLVTAGGTFPWQTLPGPLAALHPLLPMSYAVDGMRQLMYGGGLDAAWGDVAVLAAWMGGALALAALGITRMTHRRTLRDLQPSLIG